MKMATEELQINCKAQK